ncbi:F-box only protein 21-like isoform X1 [Acropora muricata]|uniref:F-box only protein 21-like isoform X1 n=1 Tax=Acropora muricata TaxID=159855 RepID=UPI0034E3DB12
MADEASGKTLDITLLVLADELIDMVLSYSFIDHRDLCRCAKVCKRLNVIATGNELWKKKALSRWNVWKTIPNENWMIVFRHRLSMENKVRLALQATALKHHNKIEVCKKDLDGFVRLKNEEPSLCCYVEDALCEILQEDVCKANLTHRYYAKKVQSHLKIHQLKSEWETYLALPDGQKQLEKGAMLIVRWILNEDDIDEQVIFSELDNIAQMVQESLCGNDSSIRIAVPSTMEERIARTDAANPVVIHPAACLRLLNSLKHVLYQQLHFKGNVDEYYKKENSLLHEVLKNRYGNPITLSILFIAVAKRLGVSLEPVNFPSHFLVRWKANQDPEAADSTAFKYIDCFNGGRFLSEEQCLEMLYMGNLGFNSHGFFEKATPRQVFIRMVANIINSYRTSGQQDNSRLLGLHSALNLALFLDPKDEGSRFLLARIQVHLEIDLEEAIKSCQELLNSGTSIDREVVESMLERATLKKAKEGLEDNTQKLRSDPRNSEVRFKVGMVMRHKLYNYGCVIFGWDPVCKMDELWIQQMGVDNLTGGRNQPFYNVLGDDCTQRYAAQVNLGEDANQPFNPHPQIGKFFKHFNGTWYTPNESLQQHYPEDVEDADG